MKTFQQSCAVMVLTLTLAFSVFAGQIPTPGATDPTPQQQSLVTGDISIPGATSTGDMSAPGEAALDPVTEAVLSLVQGLMSLF